MAKLQLGSEAALIASESAATERVPEISTAERIEEVALELFRERGYRGASIRDITAGSGVAISTLFHHFPNKMAILERLMYRAIDELQLRINNTLDGCSDPSERIARCVRVIVVDHCLRTSLSFVAEKEIQQLPEDVGLDIRRRRRQLRDIVLDTITEGVEQGEFECPDPPTAAFAIITMCTAVSTWYKPGGPKSPEELADLFAQYALNLVNYRS